MSEAPSSVQDNSVEHSEIVQCLSCVKWDVQAPGCVWEELRNQPKDVFQCSAAVVLNECPGAFDGQGVFVSARRLADRDIPARALGRLHGMGCRLLL